MKTRFSTFDLICSVAELQQYVGLRVNQVYDIDSKTYLIRLQKTEEKVILLLESGSRIHSTGYEWPKNVAPSGFSMKLRKHLRNKRLESLKQLGLDRIVDLQFGTGEAAYHVILELYDKGNIILTDCDMTILYVLRPHTEGDRIRFAVKEKYPTDRARQLSGPPSDEALSEILSNAKEGENLRKILNPHLEYGPAVLDHVLLGVGLPGNTKVSKDFRTDGSVEKISKALAEAQQLVTDAMSKTCKGFIIQKVEKRPTTEGAQEDLMVNQEFHPILFRQHAQSLHVELESFDKAVDQFFSALESQKIDMKAVVQEREAMKKLDNVRKDHTQRLEKLEQTQEADRQKAELITKNQELVEQAILSVRSALANQLPWPDISSLVKEASAKGDPVASCIKSLRLDINHITLQLTDPFEDSSDDEDDAQDKKPMFIDIDLDLTAFANARKYYDQKRSAAKKQQKTIESAGKAFKSAEKKTKQTLKEMKAIVNISKARKVFWFEKFFWFISSENYLVIGGRDMIQNELIVKRYMRLGDIYVHADIHGASSVVIKNPSGEPVPPKTLNEAGVMAICYSVAWEAKVVTTAWWVNAEQVSKTAPSGEYLSAGSFMVRGKKNFLPPGNLVMGFSFLFRLEDGSIERHSEERKVRSLEDEMSASSVSDVNERNKELEQEQEEEIVLSDGEDGEEEREEEEMNEHMELNTVEEEKDGDDEESDTEEPQNSFPDTEIKLHHTGRQISLETTSSAVSKTEDNEEETIVFLGDQKPVLVKKSQQKSKNKQNSKKLQQQQQQQVKQEEKVKQEDGKVKRGQRGKLKKIKEKYKFQDEEDRLLRLDVLQNVVTKKGKKAKEKESAENKKQEAAARREPKEKTQVQKVEGDSEEDDAEDAQEPTINTDIGIISALTGIPVPEDELLFAVPVVAPYNTLQNYKFKVKLTPGTGKRGKAARTALQIFLRDKTCSQREKELLKGVKDENLARNLPGKVKVSAPQLHKK